MAAQKAFQRVRRQKLSLLSPGRLSDPEGKELKAERKEKKARRKEMKSGARK
ncbi:MAG: hypothetical protein WAK41_01655 [Roseiarcus sp.]|uniref:hypothetical protein n=1 Tax=Roseiarcus sp. TaxID=1969460 RepID=UPI003BAF2C54